MLSPTTTTCWSESNSASLHQTQGASGRDVLAGEAAAQHLDGFDIAPADRGDVAEVRGLGPVVGEDAGDGLVELGKPDRAAAGVVFDGEVQAAVAAEQRSDP